MKKRLFLIVRRSSTCEGQEIKEQENRVLKGPVLRILKSPTMAVKEAERVPEVLGNEGSGYRLRGELFIVKAHELHL